MRPSLLLVNRTQPRWRNTVVRSMTGCGSCPDARSCCAPSLLSKATCSFTWMAIASAPVLLGTPTVAAHHEDNLEPSIRVGGSGRLTVAADRGAIEVKTGAPEGVEVCLVPKVTRGNADAAAEVFADQMVEFGKEGNQMNVEAHVRGPRGDWSRSRTTKSTAISWVRRVMGPPTPAKERPRWHPGPEPLIRASRGPGASPGQTTAHLGQSSPPRSQTAHWSRAVATGAPSGSKVPRPQNVAAASISSVSRNP